jgi:hypothetical protein
LPAVAACGYLAADDPGDAIIDFDRVDDRADVALAGIGVRVLKSFVHQTCKGVDLRNIDSGCGAARKSAAVESLLWRVSGRRPF